MIFTGFVVELAVLNLTGLICLYTGKQESSQPYVKLYTVLRKFFWIYKFIGSNRHERLAHIHLGGYCSKDVDFLTDSCM